MITTVDLPKVEDDRGNLSFISELEHVPFEIERVFWLYDVPGGGERGGHAFRTHSEFIVALSGSFDVTAIAPDGTTEVHNLNRSYRGLLISPLTFRKLSNFSTNSLALVVSSGAYDPGEYIWDPSELADLVRESDMPAGDPPAGDARPESSPAR